MWKYRAMLQSHSHRMVSTLQQQPAINESHGIYKQTHSSNQPTSYVSVLYNMIPIRARQTLPSEIVSSELCHVSPEHRRSPQCNLLFFCAQQFYMVPSGCDISFTLSNGIKENADILENTLFSCRHHVYV